MYIVQMCMYMLILFKLCTHLSHANMYVQCTNLYIECCVAHVQCTDGHIHFMKYTDIAEPGTYIDISFWLQLFYSPGWLGDWLLPDVTPIKFKHTSLIGISLRPCQKPFYHPLPLAPCRHPCQAGT